MSLVWLLGSMSLEELWALNLALFVIFSKFLLELLPEMFYSFFGTKRACLVTTWSRKCSSTYIWVAFCLLLKPGWIFCWIFFLVVPRNGKCLGGTLIDGKSCCLLSEFTRWKFTQLTNCFIYWNPNKRGICAEEAVWGQIPWDVISSSWLLLCLQGLHLLQFITHFLIKQVRKSRFISFTLHTFISLGFVTKHWS